MKKFMLLTTVITLCIIFGTIYTVTQQLERADANDPQIQMAEDMATLLNQGASPTMQSIERVDMSTSLAPFTIVYDTSGNVVAGTGYLSGKVPTIPLGVLTASKSENYNAVTWQPQSGVRIAAVAVKADHYYVVAGRSLSEVEKREDKTLLLSFVGLLLSLFVVVSMLIIKQLSRGMKSQTKKRASRS